MLSTILDEAVNGWVVTIFKNGKKEQFIYERLADAQSHLGSVESEYNQQKIKEVTRHASSM